MIPSPSPWRAVKETFDGTGRSEFPYRVKACGPSSLFEPTICPEVWGRDEAERKANAHLIAAAPDLLAALKAMLNPDAEDDLDLAMAAIRKAEGLTP